MCIRDSTVAGRSGSALAAEFQLARGEAAGSLVLRVENWAKSADNPGQQAFKDAVTLPDGTKVLVLGGPDSKDKQPVRVNVLHPDGMEVMVAQGPTGQQLLTVEQLKAIAAGPAWKPKK